MSQVRAAVPRGRAGSYMHAEAAFDDELARLRLLEQRYDARAFARLTALGPLAGTRCLEVAAGAGSVARWLAAQAGPAGQAVATDADPRFLASTNLAHAMMLAPQPIERLDWPAEQLTAYRARRPRGLVRYAVGRSPWHRRRLAGVDIARPDQASLPELPPMTRADLGAGVAS